MKIVGHSSVEMFLRYRAVDDEELDAAMQKLEAAKPMLQHLYNTTAECKQLYHHNVAGLACVGAEGQN